jgi:hypothetical protein
MDIFEQYLGLWGVDVAVKKLRPHAQFELYKYNIYQVE